MITDSARYFGSVFSYIIDRWDGSVAIRKAYDDYAGFYLINERIPIYIKYSTKRTSPWTFTFHREQQHRQEFLAEIQRECLMCFVCGKDGIVALSHKDFRQVLDHNFELQESVTIRRRHNKMYEIKGRDGILSRKMSKNSLADVLAPMKSRVVILP
jgi:penicillin-binding protein-related factor A (putative recombinase)